MNRHIRTASWLIVYAALGALASGCGSGKVKVTGKVTNAGQPLATHTGHVQVMLVPDVAPGTPSTNIPAIVNPDGSFAIDDVPPGKYKVAVEQQDTPMSDGLGGLFNDQNTKIVRDIDGKAPLNIDVSKPEG